jgi:hypothetical protein
MSIFPFGITINLPFQGVFFVLSYPIPNALHWAELICHFVALFDNCISQMKISSKCVVIVSTFLGCKPNLIQPGGIAPGIKMRQTQRAEGPT